MMRLYWSPTSPFVRKVMACAIARGIADRIERVPCDPHVSPPELLAVNPFCKVPTLIGEDQVAYIDSPLICEYLDGIGDAPPLFPAERAPRLVALRLHALGHGMMEASVARRMEGLRPEEAARSAAMARYAAAVNRALEVLEREAETLAGPLTIGAIAVGCALGYLDFRFAAEPWRLRCPRLAAWFETVAALPAFAETAPSAATTA